MDRSVVENLSVSWFFILLCYINLISIFIFDLYNIYHNLLTEFDKFPIYQFQLFYLLSCSIDIIIPNFILLKEMLLNVLVQ